MAFPTGGWPSWVPGYWRVLLNSLFGDTNYGGVVNVLQYFSNDDGTPIAQSDITTLSAYMTLISGTAINASFPSNTARAQYWPGGLYTTDTFTPITTWGTGASIAGNGTASQLDGIGFVIRDRSVVIKDLLFDRHAGIISDSVAIDILGNGHRYSQLSDLTIRRYDRGIRLKAGTTLSPGDSGGLDNGVNIVIEACRIGFDAERTVGAHFTNLECWSCTEAGLWVHGRGELKLSQFRAISNPVNCLITGNSNSAIVEHQYVECTFTEAPRYEVPILAITDAGGFARFVFAAKIVADVEDRGCMLTDGAVGRSASALVRFGPSGGQVDTVNVDGGALLSAPVAYSASGLSATVVAVAANINAGTGSHGYTARANGAIMYVDSPSADGSPYNGLVVTSTVSGGMTVTPTNFVAVVFATPHGLTADSTPQGIRVPAELPKEAFIQFVGNVGNDYDGCMKVKLVEDTTTVICEIPFTGAETGEAWIPIWTFPYEEGVNITNASALNATGISQTAVDDVSITTDLVYATYSGITLPGATLSYAGWDTVLEARDTGSTRCTGQHFVGGNINRLLVISAFNCSWTGTQLKSKRWVVDQANSSYKSSKLKFDIPGRGRLDDITFNSVPICGARVGWTEISVDGTTAVTPSGNFLSLKAPNDEVPSVGNVPTENGLEIGHDEIRFIVASETVATVNINRFETLGAIMRRIDSETPISKLDIVSAETGDRVQALVSSTDADVGMLISAKGTQQVDITPGMQLIGATLATLPIATNGTQVYVTDSNSVTPGVTYTGGGSDDALIMRLSGVWVVVMGKV